MKLQCQECETVFKVSEQKAFCSEIRCPKCKGYDVDLPKVKKQNKIDFKQIGDSWLVIVNGIEEARFDDLALAYAYAKVRQYQGL